MKYRLLNLQTELFQMPVVLKAGESEMEYTSGSDLAAAEFHVPYHITSARIADGKLILEAEEDAGTMADHLVNNPKGYNIFDGAEY